MHARRSQPNPRWTGRRLRSSRTPCSPARSSNQLGMAISSIHLRPAMNCTSVVLRGVRQNRMVLMRLKKALSLLLMPVLVAVYSTAGAQSKERPCQADDLPGTWEVLSIRSLHQQLPRDYQDLLQPYQLITFGKDASFRRIGFSRKVELADAVKVLFFSPPESFRIDSGTVTTTGATGAVLERYECRFFLADLPNSPIASGMISLMWRVQGQPSLLHAYRKVE